MNKNSRITLDMSVMDAAIAISEGNPGAASVCGQLLQDPSGMGLLDLCHLDDMALYGPNIWIGYKDICKEDIDLFREKIRNRSIKAEVKNSPHYSKS